MSELILIGSEGLDDLWWSRWFESFKMSDDGILKMNKSCEDSMDGFIVIRSGFISLSMRLLLLKVFVLFVFSMWLLDSESVLWFSQFFLDYMIFIISYDDFM